ncbi:hypothetical protein [Nocardioides sp.]|jgi:hypothetical protein|uniref:hypothetical protein n=1 Tax=Nocardioides sp. TaxID=35761 RepID=UPI0031FEE1BA|nr:hypothetical protein [Nocardioides sp.]
MGTILMLALMSCLVATGAASAHQQAGTASQTLNDANNDVKFDEDDPGGTILKGDWGGDIRTVKAVVGDKRVVVKVGFDHVRYTRERLSLEVTLPASSSGLTYVASLVGNTSLGVPTQSLVQVATGSSEAEPVDCPGFKVTLETDRWSFSVPKDCLQPQRFKRKALIVRTSYRYDNGVAEDRFPASGKTWFN